MVDSGGYWFTQAPLQTIILLLGKSICMEIAVMSLLLLRVHGDCSNVPPAATGMEIAVMSLLLLRVHVPRRF
jgi:hypothetical protein